jgi:hypothetical protein
MVFSIQAVRRRSFAFSPREAPIFSLNVSALPPGATQLTRTKDHERVDANGMNIGVFGRLF